LVLGVMLITPQMAVPFSGDAWQSREAHDLVDPRVALAPTASPTPTATPRPVAAARVAPAPTTRPASAAPTVRAVVPATTGGGGAVVLASWYGPGFQGNRTACGQTYNMYALSVAHKSLPCGTLVTLSYQGNTVTLPVQDRGPYIAGRTFDLSLGAKNALGCPDLCWVTWH
jgi:rare lipoprotein A (peptidoglycan hydrolase)